MDTGLNGGRRSSAWVRAGRFLAIQGIIGTVLSLAGCANMINPYVDWQCPSCDTNPVPIAKGYERANDYIKSYQAAIRNQEFFREATGLTLIPISALALRYGVMGEHAMAVTNLGVTGAAIYGSSVWLGGDSRRVVIYTQGSKAMACIKTLMAPYNAFDNEKIQGLDHDIKTLNAAMTATQKAVRLVTFAETKNQAQEYLDTAQQTLEAGYKLQIQLGQAGAVMNAAIDRAAAGVNMALAGTVPALSTLPQISAGLANMAQEIGPAPTLNEQPTAPPPPPGSRRSDFLKSQWKPLDLPSLKAATNALAARVNSFKMKLPVELLKTECGLKASAIQTALSVVPPSPQSVVVPAAGSVLLKEHISGGSGHYMVTMAKKGDKLPTVSSPVPFGAEFEVEVKPGTPPGPYWATIVDTENRVATFKVMVTESKTQPGSGSGTKTPGKTPTPGSGTKTPGKTPTPGSGTKTPGKTPAPGSGTKTSGKTPTAGNGTKTPGKTPTPGEGAKTSEKTAEPDKASSQ